MFFPFILQTNSIKYRDIRYPGKQVGSLSNAQAPVVKQSPSPPHPQPQAAMLATSKEATPTATMRPPPAAFVQEPPPPAEQQLSTQDVATTISSSSSSSSPNPPSQVTASAEKDPLLSSTDDKKMAEVQQQQQRSQQQMNGEAIAMAGQVKVPEPVVEGAAESGSPVFQSHSQSTSQSDSHFPGGGRSPSPSQPPAPLQHHRSASPSPVTKTTLRSSPSGTAEMAPPAEAAAAMPDHTHLTVKEGGKKNYGL